MTMNLGYLVGTAIFLTVLIALVWWQVMATRFHPFLYWATIIASTTAGTTMADFATRSLGIGYTGGSALLLGCVLASLIVWHRALGSISVDTVREPKAELFYGSRSPSRKRLASGTGRPIPATWLYRRSGYLRGASPCWRCSTT
jgi:uncharacterized membrane-anchored protein